MIRSGGPGGVGGPGDVRGYQLYSLGPQVTIFNQGGVPISVQDVGGSKGERSVRLSVHGSKTYDSRLLQDGMRYNALTPGVGPPVAPAPESQYARSSPASAPRRQPWAALDF